SLPVTIHPHPASTTILVVALDPDVARAGGDRAVLGRWRGLVHHQHGSHSNSASSSNHAGRRDHGQAGNESECGSNTVPVGFHASLLGNQSHPVRFFGAGPVTDGMLDEDGRYSIKVE